MSYYSLERYMYYMVYNGSLMEYKQVILLFTRHPSTCKFKSTAQPNYTDHVQIDKCVSPHALLVRRCRSGQRKSNRTQHETFRHRLSIIIEIVQGILINR